MKHILPNTKYVYAHMIEFALIRIVFAVFLYICFHHFPFYKYISCVITQCVRGWAQWTPKSVNVITW